MYWYATVRSGANYERSLPATAITRLIAALPDLRWSGRADFESAPGHPWLAGVIARADRSGNYAVAGPLPDRANVVELTFFDGDDADWGEGVAIHIASALGWEALIEHEGRRLWPPGDPSRA